MTSSIRANYRQLTRPCPGLSAVFQTVSGVRQFAHTLSTADAQCGSGPLHHGPIRPRPLPGSANHGREHGTSNGLSLTAQGHLALDAAERLERELLGTRPRRLNRRTNSFAMMRRNTDAKAADRSAAVQIDL